ncbi:hypothetical protein SAMN06297129_1877 [Pseudooceanicola antarcticus]|uniref:DUF2218 domain-containing protein n=1 Tax=Pseudooceanicola antarcticus TaxID=1247613 RepID=A0A285IRA4_9RHOB|nr:DUF2218 domain-containing protein [Pseudooceanicola antarcticus]PJE31846.1 DUF2218 domain-containing protein [Pseudooceanicola antarcticus]SNY50555.1 hypothetical protein SAMN06297129_1877 [Pseudooceanicola antarcticus]
MQTATAHFETDQGSKYLQQLLKHFAHKIEVNYTETEGRAALPPGPAELRADATGLHMQVSAESDEGLDRAKHIIEDHLVRFAFRENLEKLDWQEA